MKTPFKRQRRGARIWYCDSSMLRKKFPIASDFCVTHYDLYGARNVSAFQAKIKLENILGIRFEERESSFQGGAYFKYKNQSENFILKNNLDLIGGEPAEQTFDQYQILLYINSTDRSAELSSKILEDESFELLRHEFL